MTKHTVSIQLYDADITDLLNGWGADILLPRPTPDHLGVFENLQEQELIYAIYQKNFTRAYSLLRKLEHVLSPIDAAAACLCALAGTPKLMDTLLDHCPPIPAFQFQGVGLTSSLLGVAARHDKTKMLDLLLERGADPTGGPLSAKSPVEEAFCATAYSTLKRLLEIPDLEIALTDDMLNTWGALTVDDPGSVFSNPCDLWCCQLLLERLTGEPAVLFAPLSVPPQLQLGHALHHANYALALQICNARPLTEKDASDVLEHYAPDRLDFTLFEEDGSIGTLPYAKREQEVRFLCQLLHCRPNLLHTPQMRTAVSLAALSLPEEDPFLTHWIHQLEDGPVLLPQLPLKRTLQMNSFLFEETVSVEPAFFIRWEQRFGSHLVPTMDINAPSIKDLNPIIVRQILEHIHFIGSPTTDALSALAVQLLLHAPTDLLFSLLQPDGLLAQEPHHLLLDACQLLPLSRRNQILPYIRKATDYRL